MKISKRGWEDDGSSNIIVSNNFSVLGSLQSPAKASMWDNIYTLSGTVIPRPGVYKVYATGSNNEGWFTGTVPPASSWPGARLFIAPLGVQAGRCSEYLLTGSAVASDGTVFVMTAAARTGSFQNTHAGTKLHVSAGGSACLLSDGFHWCLCAGTGTYRLEGLLNS